MPNLDPQAVQRWQDGRFSDSYAHLGAHPEGEGSRFGVWAPHADFVSVVGDFNGWDPNANPLEHAGAGLWSGVVEGARPGHRYKLHIVNGHYTADKTDPYAFHMEPPASGGSTSAGLASVVTDLSYDWGDATWMASRKGPGSLSQPISIYEVHLGSWRHKRHGESLSYRELADPLADHVERLGFTHVELLPVMEHPYYGSWGYQVVGFFAPTYRYGSTQDLMYLIDRLHQRGIGVLLDWVPAHFAADPQGLVYFDGAPLFEYEDERMRTHPDWGTYVFDYGKPGVRNFLLSSARFWLDKYHIDGLRVDAVASMLYRDYSRTEWTPNVHGGRENLEAISLLKTVNEEVYTHHPDVLMVAEESTAWPGVSQPTYNGGLGFLYKWNMGWMHDTLEFFSKDPAYRKYHHHELTFPLHYAFSEHFTLPLSHDEVVHGKGSLWGKMPGDPWQKAANLRLLYGHMVGHPGKKLLFMGSEWGQPSEWNHDAGLRWDLLDEPLHAGVIRWVEDIFRLYREHPALHDDSPASFSWVDHGDREQSVVSYLRQGGGRTLLFVFNGTPVPRHNYRIGVPEEGVWREVINSDAENYGGGGIGNYGGTETAPAPVHGHAHSLVLTLPPLAILVLERTEETEEGQTAAADATGTAATASRAAAAKPTTAKKPKPRVSSKEKEKAASKRRERADGTPPPTPPTPASRPPSAASEQSTEGGGANPER